MTTKRGPYKCSLCGYFSNHSLQGHQKALENHGIGYCLWGDITQNDFLRTNPDDYSELLAQVQGNIILQVGRTCMVNDYLELNACIGLISHKNSAPLLNEELSDFNVAPSSEMQYSDWKNSETHLVSRAVQASNK